MLETARAERRALSVGLVGNCADVLPELVRRGVVPDILTDQTSAHDPLNGYVPNGMTLERGAARCARVESRRIYPRARSPPWARTSRPCWRCKRMGAVTFDYGNNIRTQAKQAGVERCVRYSRLRARVHPAAVLRRPGPFRWVALSGDPADIHTTDQLALELFPDNEALQRWMHLARDKIHFQGLPARICWLGYGERAEFGLAINELVRTGEIEAPIVIGRDHLDTGSVASPYRETEAMRDGSDAIADWPLLNALRQHRGGRILGLHSQRRRRGHRLLAARRHGGGGRWHRRSGAAPGARAHHRSGHGRHAACGCGLFDRRAIRRERECARSDEEPGTRD